MTTLVFCVQGIIVFFKSNLRINKFKVKNINNIGKIGKKRTLNPKNVD